MPLSAFYSLLPAESSTLVWLCSGLIFTSLALLLAPHVDLSWGQVSQYFVRHEEFKAIKNLLRVCLDWKYANWLAPALWGLIAILVAVDQFKVAYLMLVVSGLYCILLWELWQVG